MVERIRTKGWPDFLHPDDIMPWVHSENLAEMVWLALTHPSVPNEAFIAADRNVPIRACYAEVAAALGRQVVPPQRSPTDSTVRLGKVGAQLGYKPVYSFEETVSHLVELAKAPRTA